jgi:predicted dehydrogenase
MYARDLLHEGYIGEVLTANLRVISQQALERGAGRIWQGNRTNGANTLTITGGHAARPAAQRCPGLQARGTRLRFGHEIRDGLRSRGDAPQAHRRDRALGR